MKLRLISATDHYIIKPNRRGFKYQIYVQGGSMIYFICIFPIIGNVYAFLLWLNALFNTIKK